MSEEGNKINLTLSDRRSPQSYKRSYQWPLSTVPLKRPKRFNHCDNEDSFSTVSSRSSSSSDSGSGTEANRNSTNWEDTLPVLKDNVSNLPLRKESVQLMTDTTVRPDMSTRVTTLFRADTQFRINTSAQQQTPQRMDRAFRRNTTFRPEMPVRPQIPVRQNPPVMFGTFVRSGMAAAPAVPFRQNSPLMLGLFMPNAPIRQDFYMRSVRPNFQMQHEGPSVDDNIRMEISPL